jgi:hypothetical protein
MQHEDSHSPTSDVAAQLRLIPQLESGQWDSLECPKCHNHSVAAWFTNPVPREYRTWFVCSRCGFRVRIQNSGQPCQFCSERVNKELESYDAEVLGKRKLSE